MNVEALIHNKYVLYGGLAGAAFLAYKFFFAGNTAAASGNESGSVSYPDVTYAATPIQSNGGVLGTSGGDVGTSALEALRDAINPKVDSGISLATISANSAAALNQTRVSIFSSLATTLKAQTGLHYIRAIVPGLGQFVVTNATPKKPVVQPKKPAPKKGSK